MALEFALARASAEQVARGEVVPIIASVSAPLDWGVPREVAVTNTAVRLCEKSGGRRVLVMIRNLNAAVHLRLSIQAQNIAMGWRVDALDAQIMPLTGELWGYAASAITVIVWEAYLAEVEGG